MKRVLALGIAGAAITALFGLHDPSRAVLGWLAAFGVALGAALGALILAMVFHVTNAKWPAAVRPQLMGIVRTLPVLLLLFVPIALGHTHPMPEIREQQIWLAPPFLFARAVVYFAVWIGLSQALTAAEARAAKEPTPENMARARVVSGLGLPLTALTLTFASFDWFMSVEPGWVSNMYGVYFFAGGMAGALAVTSLLVWRTAPDVGPDVIGAVGRLLFMSTIFWAYIAFFQLMLVWIANIPREAGFYALRWQAGWQYIALLLLFGKFVVPFLALLPRANKRRAGILAMAGAWLLLMDACDLAWLVLPRAGGSLQIQDAAPFLGIGGLVAAFGMWRANRVAPSVSAEALADAMRYRAS